MLSEPNSLQRQMTLGMGSSMHGILQAQMQMIGLVPEKNIEVEYIIAEHHIRGKIDWIFQHPSVGDVVVEMKNPHRLQVRDHHHRVDALLDAQLSLAEYSQNKTEGVLLMMETACPTGCASSRTSATTYCCNRSSTSSTTSGCAWDANEPPRHCCVFGSPQMTSCDARFTCWLKP